MSKQQHSGSLQIVQHNQQQIQITQNSLQIHTELCNNFLQSQKIDDTFQLSLDQNSLSFQIEELKQQSTFQNILKQGNINSEINVVNSKLIIIQKQQLKPIPVVQQQRKRKRKEIFEKYKQKSIENVLVQPDLQMSPNNDLMNTFDEIFKIKSPEKTQKNQLKQSPLIKNQSQKSSKIQTTGFKKKESAFGMAATSFESIAVFESPSNEIHIQVDPPLYEAQNKDLITEFKIQTNITNIHKIDPQTNIIIGSTNSFLIESNINRISMIQNQEQSFSRDSGDIETILKSQLFREDILQQTIHKDDTSYKNFQISMVNPSIMANSQRQSPKNNNNLNVQQRFGLKRQKTQAALPVIQNLSTLKRNLSQRKMKIFDSVYLQNQTIVKQKIMHYEQNRIPIYLRQIRRRNTIFPNFYIKTNKLEFYKEQNVAFSELLSQFKKGISFLDFVHQLAYERYSILKSLEKNLLNSLSLDTFLNCGWEKIKTLKQVPILQPHENFNKRKYEYQKVKGALANYLYITQYYEKCNLNLEDPKAQKKYMQIRSKFWQIEKNIKMIGQDIYLLAIQEVFPSHYYEFLKILKGQYPLFEKSNQQLEYMRNLLGKYYALRQQGDIIFMSQIGKYLKQKLERTIQKSFII